MTLRTMKTNATRLITLAAALAPLACGESPTGQEALQRDLDTLRATLSRYQDPAVALQEGFVADAFCVASPGGAMGYHYLNPRRVDAEIRAEEPEVLLYAREGGQLRLVGVEYMKPVFQGGVPHMGPAAPTVTEPAPTFLGQTFQGPMPGHGPGNPWHYDLHVWLFRENPAGTFSQFNPALSCS